MPLHLNPINPDPYSPSKSEVHVMNRRTNESPMDFEWQSGKGPIDPTSPFMQVGQDAQRGQKRTWSAFGSPQKPAVPNLREPASQPHFFNMPSQPSSPIKPLPALPHPASSTSVFQNPKFTTPRKLDIDFASSGAEDTPDNADSEATPETLGRTEGAMGMKGIMTFSANGQGNESPTGSPGKKKGFLSGLRSSLGSSGRGELRRGEFSHKLEAKIQKRRAQDERKRKTDKRVVRRRKGSSDSEDEDSDRKDNRNSKAKTAEKNGPGFAATFFAFIDSHPNLPHILSFYAQLALNVFLIGCIMWLIYSFWSTIVSDVDKKSEEAIAEALAEMAICAKDYRENRCEPGQRVPAMESVCQNWEKCMNRDPRRVGRGRVSAHTFAEIFNSFIEPISYKAMLFTFILVFGSIFISNMAFGHFRNRAMQSLYQHQQFQQQQPFQYSQHMLPPQTPRHPSQEYYQYGLMTPVQTQGAIEPGPSQGAGIAAGDGSPSKRLAYH